MSTNQPLCPGGTYTVRAGDTLWGIARAVNVSLDALERANPGLDPNALRVGQIICLPVAAPAPRVCGMGLVPYTIRAGDTLYELALRSGTTVDALLRLNPGVDPNSLRVGEIICLPPAGATEPSTVTCPPGLTRYTVQPGDTLWALAQRTGTTVERIQAQNPGLDPNTMIVGRKICLPPVVGGPAPAPGRCPATAREYVVQPGDTYFLLAQRFGVAVAAIQRANPGVDPNALMVGQIICVPRP